MTAVSTSDLKANATRATKVAIGMIVRSTLMALHRIACWIHSDVTIRGGAASVFSTA
jgi:hypothetical protein